MGEFDFQFGWVWILLEHLILIAGDKYLRWCGFQNTYIYAHTSILYVCIWNSIAVSALSLSCSERLGVAPNKYSLDKMRLVKIDWFLTSLCGTSYYSQCIFRFVMYTWGHLNKTITIIGKFKWKNFADFWRKPNLFFSNKNNRFISYCVNFILDINRRF